MRTPTSVDCETFRIGPGAVVPKVVCLATAVQDPHSDDCAMGLGAKDCDCGAHQVDLVAACEARCESDFRALLLDNSKIVVGHNLAFDLSVMVERFPVLEPLVWKMLADGRGSDTMIREQLLRLSTTGKIDTERMPDGSEVRVFYTLEQLVADYLGIDLSTEKKGGDSWRLNFDTLDGMPAAQYPRDAADYARDDADYTLQVWYKQEAKVRSQSGPSSLSVDAFQTAASFALLQVTKRGMRVDADAFRRLEAEMAAELSDEKLRPLVEARMLRPSVPPTPYVRQEQEARDLVAEWLGVAAEDVDWRQLDAGLRQSLEDCGVKFKAPEAASKDVGEIKRRLLCLKVAADTGRDPAAVLKSCPTAEDAVVLAEELSVEYKLTDTGGVCTDGDVVEQLAHLDPAVLCLQQREELQKMVTTELPGMTWDGKPADVVHFPFRTLIETGRTSSYGAKKKKLFPSRNGQNVDPRTRPVFVPRPGFLFCSCDYSTLELACVGQTMTDLFGSSSHRDLIADGVDLHAFLGARLAYELGPEDFRRSAPSDVSLYQFFLAKKETDRPFYDAWRKLAKPVGLGYPGGLGPQKLVEIARKDPYHVDVVAMACERFEVDPDEFQVDRSVLYYAKKLHRMTEEGFYWTPALKGVALAGRLKRIWLDTHPDMERYFEWCAEQGDEQNPLLARPTAEEPDREVEGLCYTTPMGMHRAGCTFTALANGRAMQSPAAEGFKRAIFDVVRACQDRSLGSVLLGCGVVDEVHDEMIVEVPEDRADACAREVGRLMVAAMQTVLRDVPVKATPCLMRRWYKEAEQVLDSRGMIVPWEPERKAA